MKSLSPPSIDAFLLNKEVGERWKRKRAGYNGKGKEMKIEWLPLFPFSFPIVRRPRTYIVIFTIISIFIGVISESLCRGEKDHPAPAYLRRKDYFKNFVLSNAALCPRRDEEDE